jgi:hypothetical protein
MQFLQALDASGGAERMCQKMEEESMQDPQEARFKSTSAAQHDACRPLPIGEEKVNQGKQSDEQAALDLKHALLSCLNDPTFHGKKDSMPIRVGILPH